MTEAQLKARRTFAELWVQTGWGFSPFLGPLFVWMQPGTGLPCLEPIELMEGRN